VFRTTDKTNASGSGTVTLIGPGVRVTGSIAFSGYLRVQGDVVGDITCDGDSAGTTVVHGAGHVVGSITTPHIVVGGRVEGPLHASESIEIHDGARVIGDTRYKRLAIEVGGVIEGSLTPAASEMNMQTHERRVAAPDSPEIEALDPPLAHHRRASDRSSNKSRVVAGIAAAVLVVAGAAAWLRRGPTVVPPPAAAVAPQPEPAPTAFPSGDTKAAAAATSVAPAPQPQPEPSKPERTRTENAKADAGRIVTVEGTDHDKPAGVVFVNTREPAVLFLKPRQGGGDGTRMELPARAKKRLPITPNDVLRVAQGQDVDIYYQGRKLSRATIESGQWIGFVPLEAGAGSRE
jgi:cytoskeletal protein CcmA (bactofilin family)